MTFGLCSLSEALVTSVILDGKGLQDHIAATSVTFVKRNVCN